MEKLMLPILCLGMMAIDPLFFYIPVINTEKKCITFDRNLAMIGVVLLRTICDFLYLICLTIPQWTRFRQKYSRNHFLFLSCLLVLSNLPLPQGTVISLFIRQKTQTGMSFVAVIIYSQIPLRIIIIVCHLNYLANPLGGFDIRLFVLIYSWSAYLVGALWYFYSIFKKAHCWKKACKMLTGCDDDRFCDESLRHYQGNTTNCSFGIYNELIQYHIVEVKDFPRKLLFCFRWGLQSLSSFGQNLQTDGNTRDNLFVIAISISGVLLFVILIGEMQRYKQSVDARVERRKMKVQQLNNCMLFKNLSENLQQQVKKYRGSVWKETKGVSVKGIDAVNLLSDLSEDLKRKIKRELCLEFLKKVKEFERWSEAMLDELCDCVKPISYTEHTHIVLEGDKIDEILFCVQGKLRTYLVRNVNTGSTAGSSRRRTILNHLRDGDEFFGEELVAWFQADPYSSDLPISTKTILVLTEVVGFALMSVDLKSILIKNHAAIFLQSFWRFKIMKKHQAAHFVQLSWRFRRILRSRRNMRTSVQAQTPPTESHQLQQLSFEIKIQEPYIC